jgi:indolepyruvate ferredoxin oxidoreductase beta subunit
VERLLELMTGQVGAVLAFDAGALAREAGSPLAVNMVLLGALAACDILPFGEEEVLQVLRTRTNPKFLEANLRAFESGRKAAQEEGNWRRRPAA